MNIESPPRSEADVLTEPSNEGSSLFASLAEHSRDFIGVAHLDGRLIFVNPAGHKLLEVREGRVPGPGLAQLSDLFSAGDHAFLREAILPDVGRSHRWSGDFRLATHGADAALAIELDLYHLFGEDGATPVALAIVCRDIAERKRSEGRLRTLVDAGAALSHALVSTDAFAKVAELIAQTMATYCIIDLFHTADEGERHIERVAAFHFERAKRRLLNEFAGTLPDQDHPAHPLARLLRDGSSSLVTHADDAWMQRVTLSEDHGRALRALGVLSEITVPLVAAGTVVGALTCGLADEAERRPNLPRAYEAEDVFFLEELGRRTGVAIENAQLYERQHRIAAALQEASLTLRPPAIPGLAVDAAYRPGSAEATIGGDWYDVFAVPDGRVVFTVGDVMGNGLNAAVTMTKLRQAMQSAAMVDADPNVMLDVADRTLHIHDPHGYATALAAVFDPQTGTTTMASAGHAGPLLRMAPGDVVECPCSGLLLGMTTGIERVTVQVATPAGSTLVFFTDGLTEATRSLSEGMLRLRAACAQDAVMRSARPALAIVDTVLGGHAAGDDVAVLTVAFA